MNPVGYWASVASQLESSIAFLESRASKALRDRDYVELRKLDRELTAARMELNKARAALVQS